VRKDFQTILVREDGIVHLPKKKNPSHLVCEHFSAHLGNLYFFSEQDLACSHALSTCGSEALFKTSGVVLQRFLTPKVYCTIKYHLISWGGASKLKIIVSRIFHRH